MNKAEVKAIIESVCVIDLGLAGHRHRGPATIGVVGVVDRALRRRLFGQTVEVVVAAGDDAVRRIVNLGQPIRQFVMVGDAQPKFPSCGPLDRILSAASSSSGSGSLRLERTEANKLLESVGALSFQSGALIVVVASAALAALWAGLLRSKKLTWLLGLTTPFAVASALYWSPVLGGADSTEFRAWSLIFIGPWSALGVAASTIMIILVRRRRGRRTV